MRFTLLALLISGLASAADPVPPAPTPDASPPLRKSVIDFPAKADGIELIAPDAAALASAPRVIQITAKCDGTVQWLVINSATQPVAWMEVPNTKMILIFPNDSELTDRITIVASAHAKEVRTPMVSLALDMKPSKKAPLPMPVPEQKTAAGPLHVTIITDAAVAKASPMMAAVVESRDLQQQLMQRGHQRWLMDQTRDADEIKAKKFDQYLRELKKVPIYIIQDESGAVLSYALMPTTVQELLNAVDAIDVPSAPSIRKKN